MRVVLQDPRQALVRDDADPAPPGRRNRVIRALEQEAVQVDEVARNVKGGDLPAPVSQNPVPVREALKQDVALGRAASFPDDVLTRPNLPGQRDAATERFSSAVRELAASLKLPHKRVGPLRVTVTLGHEAPRPAEPRPSSAKVCIHHPLSTRGATRLSATATQKVGGT